MLVRRLSDCDEFVAGDGCVLRELLHPHKAPLAIRYSLAHAKVAPGRTTQAHRLKTAEVYYILAGAGRMHIDNESAQVDVGCAVYIPPGSIQYITNTGRDDLVFLCIVDPAWQEADEEIVPGFAANCLVIATMNLWARQNDAKVLHLFDEMRRTIGCIP